MYQKGLQIKKGYSIFIVSVAVCGQNQILFHTRQLLRKPVP